MAKLEAGELQGLVVRQQLSGWDARSRWVCEPVPEIIDCTVALSFGIAADGTQIPGRPARGAQSRMKSPCLRCCRCQAATI